MTSELLENILKNAERPLLKSELLVVMENVDFPVLNTMLDELEAQGKIVVGGKGVLWTLNGSRKFNELIESSVIHDG